MAKMKYTSKLILLCLAFSSVFRLVLADGNCSPDYLKSLGMIMESEPVTKPKALLTSHILMTVGMKLAVRPRSTSDLYFEAVKNGFAAAELDSDENGCIRCFSDSTMCVVRHCKSHCMSNPCRRPCLKCIEAKCKGRLLECIGQPDIVNACTWEDEYRNFKSPFKGILGTDDDGSASGSSA